MKQAPAKWVDSTIDAVGEENVWNWVRVGTMSRSTAPRIDSLAGSGLCTER
jgi:hypothetical protein